MSVLVESFLTKHPEHAARILNTASEEMFLSLMTSNPDCLERIVSNMSPSYMAHTFERYPDVSAEMICSKVSAPFIATILRYVNKEKRSHILDALDTSKKQSVSELLHYSTKQIGYYLQHTELVLSENLTAADAIVTIGSIPKLQHPIYIVDSNYHLKGTLDLFSLIKYWQDDSVAIKNIINKKEPIEK